MKTWILAAGICGVMGFATMGQSAVVFALGTFNSNHSEFEQESNSFNNNKFYVHAGDYSAVQGTTGFGAHVLQPERLRDGPTADEWVLSMEGFRRALTVSSGFEEQDVFFQLSQEQAQAHSLLFRIRFHQMGGGSQHHLQFTLNGQVFATLNDITVDTGILEYQLEGAMLNYSAGGNVIGLHRIGGSSSWIAMDALELHTVPEPNRVVLSGVAGLCLLWRRRRNELSKK